MPRGGWIYRDPFDCYLGRLRPLQLCIAAPGPDLFYSQFFYSFILYFSFIAFPFLLGNSKSRRLIAYSSPPGTIIFGLPSAIEAEQQPTVRIPCRDQEQHWKIDHKTSILLFLSLLAACYFIHPSIRLYSHHTLFFSPRSAKSSFGVSADFYAAVHPKTPRLALIFRRSSFFLVAHQLRRWGFFLFAAAPFSSNRSAAPQHRRPPPVARDQS